MFFMHTHIKTYPRYVKYRVSTAYTYMRKHEQHLNEGYQSIHDEVAFKFANNILELHMHSSYVN